MKMSELTTGKQPVLVKMFLWLKSQACKCTLAYDVTVSFFFYVIDSQHHSLLTCFDNVNKPSILSPGKRSQNKERVFEGILLTCTDNVRDLN